VAESSLIEDAADELYGLPPGDFTRARDERAKQLRADGERDAASEVKKLRRPTVAAWALNQLSRRKRKELDELLSAGEQLRAAQDELLGGGDRSAFQEAAARERDLVARLSVDTTTMASEAGERGAGLQEKVAETLHAASLDEATAEELRAGRLVKEREAIGGFGAMSLGAPPPTRSKSKTRAPARKAAPAKKDAEPERRAATKQERRAAAEQEQRAAAEREQRAAAAEQQRRAAAERKQRLAAARTDERHARRDLDAAERAVAHAQERADAAEANAREAAERARTTAERLKEAKRALTGARRTHAASERALDKAETATS
jgi:hypothetical protein